MQSASDISNRLLSKPELQRYFCDKLQHEHRSQPDFRTRRKQSRRIGKRTTANGADSQPIFRRQIHTCLFDFAIGLSLNRTYGAGGFALSFSLECCRPVRNSSPAFALLDFWMGEYSTLGDFIHHNTEELVQFFDEGKSSPRDANEDGLSLLWVSAPINQALSGANAVQPVLKANRHLWTLSGACGLV